MATTGKPSRRIDTGRDYGTDLRMSLSPSTYGNLAALVVAGHFVFIIFVVFGGLLTLRWKWAPWIHVPCFMWGSWIELTGGICPLTPMENRLRRAAGSSEYMGGFIEHYLLSVIYPTGLDPEVQLTLAVGLMLLNVAIYTVVLQWRRVR